MDDWDQSIEEPARLERVAESPSALDAGWKDELNLAEFPIAALTDRIPDGQTTLVFEDKLECRDSAPIVRRLTIMGTHKHGLPTSLDDEVLVGLIQLTKRRNNFTEAKVGFSRYELIELLGWPQSGQSYRRIEEALHRWVGVVLMYENAWWDNNAKSWVDENFHVLDNVTLYDRERRRPAPRSGKPVKAEKAPLPLSSFRWNEVIFQSFQSGNLKQLDLEFYLRLRLPTTKRMFRFLDKRFYRRSRLDFDLRTMACEHIGMSRSYAPTELKRRLKPALEELEQLGFLEPLSLEERYSYVKRGCWRIILIRGKTGQADEPPVEETSELIEVLKARGVTAKIAAELVETHPSGRIETKVDVFDWLLRNGDKRVGKNPAGYLVASIRADYQAPGDFPTAESTEAKAAATEVERVAEEKGRQARRQAHDESERDQARETELRAAWDRLHDAEREAILSEVKVENPGLGRWKKMLEPLCLVALEKRLGTARVAQGTLFPENELDA
ncbi:Replication initiator protein A [Singulisphaera sp. GP187]|uniref:replication initiator protein A n=1 Tax=Singulisphaera sp. GP187 TaxID=1882752 RepID=UPI0009294E01|nr:replication initiator protein A [Singulisphaera sp. GP187]SIO67974.1 Replication initiator protein A [Singulisphaera sp. GP187]